MPFLHVQEMVAQVQPGPGPNPNPNPNSHPNPNQVVEEDFERATSYAQQFEEYRVVHCFGENWNYEAHALGLGLGLGLGSGRTGTTRHTRST